MGLFKSIKEAIRLSKEFNARVEELERLIIKPTKGDWAGQLSASISGMFKPATIYSKIESLESKVKSLERSNQLLLDYFKLKEKEVKSKSKLVPRKKK